MKTKDMRTNKCRFVLSAIMFTFSVETLCAQVTTWDLEGNYPSLSDYASATIPNGVWSYGWKDYDPGSGLPGAFYPYNSAWDLYDGYCLQAGGMPEQRGGPGHIWKNVGDSEAYGVGPGQVSVSSDAGATSTVRFTAPFSGRFDVVGGYGWGNSGAGSRSVFLNTSELWRVSGNAGSFDFSGAGQLILSAGDTLDFTVWGNGDGYGNTPVWATVTGTAIPEPSHYATIAGAILLGLGMCRRASPRREQPRFEDLPR